MSSQYGYRGEPPVVGSLTTDDAIRGQMGFSGLTRQSTASSLPLAGRLPPAPWSARHGSADPRVADPALQWLLEGRGWSVLQPLVDLLATCLATVLALGGPRATLGVSATRAPLLALPVFVMVLLYVRGLYRPRLRTLVLDSLVPGVSAVSVAVMSVAVLGLLVNGRAPGQGYWLGAWALALGGVGAGRAALSLGQRWARQRGLIGRAVLILGAGVVGSQVARRLESHPEYGLRPVGFLDSHPRSLEEVGDCDVPVIGTADDVDEIVARTGVRKLIVAFSSVADARVSRLIQRCQELGVEVSVVPRMFDTINNRLSYETVGGLPLLSLSTVSPNGTQFAIKHAVDRAAAALLLLALAPLMALIALAVRLSSPGPALFRQRRVGRDGTVFDLYKFRSMQLAPTAEPTRAPGPLAGGTAAGAGPATRGQHVRYDLAGAADGTVVSLTAGARNGADGASVIWLRGDIAPGGVEGPDRRTAVGQVIRRWGLDELPQLINVLRGEMSLVGPRPERPEFVELFGRQLDRYEDRHRVRSGITGWAQVHGLRGNTSVAERVEWDNYYIAHWSLGLDLRILLLTALALARGGE